MKKVLLFLMFSLLFVLSSCGENIKFEDNYIEANLIINLEKEEVKIMQLTDLHLSYGFDYMDKKTYKLIDKMIIDESPDLIVITGDMFMSIIAPRLLKSFIKFIEKYQIPWTVTFGNHEREYHSIKTMVKILLTTKTKYLYFHYGPKLSEDDTHGYSNFKIELMYNDNPFFNVYLLDSKDQRKDGIKDKRFPYDYISKEQVNWYKEEVGNDNVENIIFMHMPLIQYLEYDGDDINETVWPQGKDTGLFDAIIEANKKTLGVFVGHDHNNEFSFYLEDVLLAYGRNSGFNAYGTNTKGARIIIYSNEGLKTYLVGENYE